MMVSLKKSSNIASCHIALLFLAVLAVNCANIQIPENLPGGWVPINPDDDRAFLAAYFLAENSNYPPNDTSYISNIRGRIQVVAGVNYELWYNTLSGGQLWTCWGQVYDDTVGVRGFHITQYSDCIRADQ